MVHWELQVRLVSLFALLSMYNNLGACSSMLVLCSGCRIEHSILCVLLAH